MRSVFSTPIIEDNVIDYISAVGGKRPRLCSRVAWWTGNGLIRLGYYSSAQRLTIDSRTLRR